jgi:hypothetical protein
LEFAVYPHALEENLMTDTPGGTPPFGSFPGVAGFPQGDMMEKMWDMMRMNPFAAAAVPGGSPSLSMMSDMLAPLTNVEELDKRITDMRAVELWLKLNLNMLQSAIQALEVQRATLATLRAFGAYAQSSMEKAQGAPTPSPSAWGVQSEKPKQDEGEEAKPKASNEAGANDAPFDPTGWWNMLQSQFNNLASLAIAQANQAAQATPAASGVSDAPDASDAEAPPEKPATAKKAPARKAPARKKAE